MQVFRKALLFLFFLFTISTYADKHALIIAIGDYPAKTGWNSISSANDVPLIQQILLQQGFKDSNITVLLNESATYQGIKDALNNLLNEIKDGDILVIHYSGHGQQIFDNNDEEIDSKDEALIPYDAWVRYTHNYQGENHLRDDELGNYMTLFRNKLGENGQLMLLLDSCHSGSASRGGVARGSKSVFAPKDWKANKNGNSTGSDMFEIAKVSDNASKFILISGASADELNYEYNGKGSLSYSFSKAMSELGTNITYRQLFAKIASIMNVIAPNQTPTIEGDLDFKLFNGDYVVQQPFFELMDIPRNDIIKIQAGKIHGIYKNTTVNILPAGTVAFDEKKIISKGNVIMSKFNESNIQLQEPLPNLNKNDYWLFVDSKTYGDISLNVYLDHSIDKNLKADILAKIESDKLNVVSTEANSDVIISEFNNDIILSTSNGMLELAKTGKDNFEKVKMALNNYAQGQYLKNLNMDNVDYEFAFQLLPIDYDVKNDQLDDAAQKPKNNEGLFTVRPEKDSVLLEVTNNGKKPIYFSIIEINSKGEIAQFFPNPNCNLNDNERRLMPGKTMVFKDCIFSFYPPYEKLVLKGFASPNPINFQTTIESQGANSRALLNPLESFVSDTYNQTRGGKAISRSANIDAYTSEFLYEIVKE